jgi:hypothetical protein
MLCLRYYLLCFLFKKSEHKRAEQVLPGSQLWGWVGERSGEVAQTMYTHISKCKNDKIKERKIFS